MSSRTETGDINTLAVDGNDGEGEQALRYPQRKELNQIGIPVLPGKAPNLKPK